MPKTDIEKTAKPPLVPCACCGKGMVELSEKLMEVLTVVREHGPVTVLQIHEKLGSNLLRTAISNRVSMLKGHKLIKGHRDGRSWVYVPV